MYSKSTGARVAQWVRSLDYLTTRTSLSPIRRGFAPGFVNYKKGCTRLAAASDKVYQLLSHCRWFSPGTPASSTTKTGCHDIAEILLKVALKHQKSSLQLTFNAEVNKLSRRYIYFIIIFYENNKINQYIISTYILKSYFMKINQILN
jgi:hypothetical protein